MSTVPQSTPKITGARRAAPWARGALLLVYLGLGASLLWASGDRALDDALISVLAIGLLATIGAGVFVLRSGLFARPILAGPPNEGLLALTFDDGPDERETRRVLALLEARGHRGTFFVIGARAANAKALLEEIVARGHGLANHTHSHTWSLPLCSVRRVVDELERTQAILRAATRATPETPEPRWLRPPAGIMSPRIAVASALSGLELVGWSASARDGTRTTVPRAVRRLARAAVPGAILVLHDGIERGDRAPIAAAVLEELLPILEARRLTSVPLDRLLLGDTDAKLSGRSSSRDTR
ncbi:MAG: polysaccharide deacetylase family protein [Deltaproteobacteria bacterium]|nr:polysaccharide deacetylase family protein [Deltaproteobacteria bacterium]